MRYGPMWGLGSDFLGIEYGESNAVNVSPQDVDGFIEAVQHGTQQSWSPLNRPNP